MASRPRTLEATKQLLDAVSEDEAHKESVMALQKDVGKKKEAEPVQVKHDEATSLGDPWENMDTKQKEEGATVVKSREQFKTHEEAIKERKAKMATVKTELDVAVADLNGARKREQVEDDDPEEEPPAEGVQGQAAATPMAQPVPRPTPSEVRRPSQRSAEEKVTSEAPATKGAPAAPKTAC